MVSLAIPQTALQSWLRPERIGQVTTLVNVLLVIWLAWLLAKISWMFMPEPEQAGEPVLPVVSTSVKQQQLKQQQTRFDERQIANWHVFGVASEEKPIKKAAVDAPETRLKLTLRGVFASNENRAARAIVGDPKGKEQGYAVGDPLPGGAKLSEVYPDRIILERNGRFETLRLPKKNAIAGPNTANQPSARRTGEVSDSSNKAAAFQKYRSEIKQNPSAFMNYVRATPARQDGKFVGFRLQAGRQRGALKELGLKPGDIVTAINGVQIDSPAKGMKAMQALGEGDTVNVTLLRGGQETSMSLTLPSAGK